MYYSSHYCGLPVILQYICIPSWFGIITDKKIQDNYYYSSRISGFVRRPPCLDNGRFSLLEITDHKKYLLSINKTIIYCINLNTVSVKEVGRPTKVCLE